MQIQKDVIDQLDKIADDNGFWNITERTRHYRYTAYAGPLRLEVEVLESIGTVKWQVDMYTKVNPYILQPWTFAKGGFGTVADGKREAIEFAIRAVQLGTSLIGEPAYTIG